MTGEIQTTDKTPTYQNGVIQILERFRYKRNDEECYIYLRWFAGMRCYGVECQRSFKTIWLDLYDADDFENAKKDFAAEVALRQDLKF